MVRLILDTDIDTDCDDAGALAVLHALAARREVEVLGVVCSVPLRWTAACVAAINEWYDRGHIPVGLAHVPGFEREARFAQYRVGREAAVCARGPLYNEIIGGAWLQDHPAWQAQDAVRLYRRLLAEDPRREVTICAIGTLTVLAQLLDSGPDDISPLPGAELVRWRVRRLVTMAAAPYPRGHDTFNWAMDLPAAARVVNDWPTPITVSHWGERVLTGARFQQAAGPEHPVSTAYRIWFGEAGRSRSSWDQLAVLCAVRGGAGLFSEHPGYCLQLDPETGEHAYGPCAPGRPDRTWLEPSVDDETMRQSVEDLMIESLTCRA